MFNAWPYPQTTSKVLHCINRYFIDIGQLHILVGTLPCALTAWIYLGDQSNLKLFSFSGFNRIFWMAIQSGVGILLLLFLVHFVSNLFLSNQPGKIIKNI